jgi:hypothetical protein
MSDAFDGLDIIFSSLLSFEGATYALAKIAHEQRLVVLEKQPARSWQGERSSRGKATLSICPLNSFNAQLLRERLPWLQPKLLGLQTSAGLGDRLGLATPGHVRAMSHFEGQIIPIFPQQSIREMARTARSPQEVMDDAMWGIFQENWQGGFGADADHLKTEEDVDACFQAGYTFFTIDPGEHVDNSAESADLGTLRELVTRLPDDMQIGATSLLGQTLDIEGYHLHFTEEILLRAMAKYGRAVAHVSRLFNYLTKLAVERPFELEVSVDETDQPTSLHEHAYIAHELKRLGVRWVSLAPRYVGRFEKGVDYIGSLDEFELDVNGHAALARYFGPYKLSLHSGSDKYSIYPLAMQATQGLVHLKTAGTSYLTALHTIAGIDADFLQNIFSFARSRYNEDRLTYHVSADLAKVSQPDQVTDWHALIDQFDARQVFHVTFGSVMTARDAAGELIFRPHLLSLLQENLECYARDLEAHFIRHLAPFSRI